MKEIFKNICLEEYNNFYENTANYFVKELTDPLPHSRPQIENYMESIARKSLDSFISSDFNVSKLTGSISYIQGFDWDYFEITIYHIRECDLNILVVPFENYITVQEYDFINYFKWDFESFFDYNKKLLYDEKIVNEIIRADDNIILGLHTIDLFNNIILEQSDSNKEILSLYEILVKLYGKNAKTKNYKNILETYATKVRYLSKSPLSQVYFDNAKKFHEIALIPIIDSIRNFQRDEIKAILDYFNDKFQDPRMLRMILTFLYTKKSIRHNTEIDFLDFTFIVIEIFKLVESVFNDLLNTYWNDKTIKNINGEDINLSSTQLTLGEMTQFFYSNDIEIRNICKKKSHFTDEFLSELKYWIKYDRNGYTHKHIIENYHQIEDCVNSAIKIICDLILILQR